MMDWFVKEDWRDLRSIAISLFALLVFLPLMSIFFRWRRKQPLFTLPKWHEVFDPSWFVILYVICSTPIGDIAKRHGWSKDAILVASLFGLGALSLLSLRGHIKAMTKKADAHGVPNAEAGIAPVVPLSTEEKRLNRKLWVALAVAALLAIGLMLALPWALGPLLKPSASHEGGPFPGVSGLLTLFVLTALLLSAMIYALVGRLPTRAKMTSSIDINATPEQIWEKLAYHDGMKNWRGIFSRIERLPEPQETYRLHYLTSENCAECGLPKVPDGESITTRIEVLAADAPHFYSIKCYPKGQTQAKGEASRWMDCEEQDFIITPLADGGSRVTSESRVDRPKVWLYLMLRFGSPVGQMLESLKAHLEGARDTTIYGTQVARIAAARLAPKFCGCATVEPMGALPA